MSAQLDSERYTCDICQEVHAYRWQAAFCCDLVSQIEDDDIQRSIN